MRELVMDKLRVDWGIRARYERRLKKRRKDSVGKKKDKSKDIYGKERERFYNRNGWEINARELGDDGNEGKFEEEIIRRKRDGQ